MASSSSSPVIEGVFAINKPPAITSAQVIRDVQAHFNPSKLFSPWLAKEKAKRDDESHNQKQKRRSWKQKQKMQVKMGHGGTLDPLATGVLILGVGSGTKSLSSFLECTKSYETVLLFGAATDSYDTEGKVVARKDYEHVTREKIDQALAKFRGEIMQKPPIFSALRIQGKRLYEYAREGKELPVEIQERPVKVEELELMEWYEGGTHEWRWPENEAEKEEKKVVEKVLHLGDERRGQEVASEDVTAGAKRKRDEDETVNGVIADAEEPDMKRPKSSPEPVASGALPDTSSGDKAVTRQAQPRGTESAMPDSTTTDAPIPTSEPCPAPAVRLRMTVTSGFYVRSLAHDLGASVDSLGIMASLVRTRQGEFELGTNALWYEDLAKGEEIWGPKVQRMLEEWQQKHGDEPRSGAAKETPSGNGKERESRVSKPAARAKVRRNSSSDEA